MSLVPINSYLAMLQDDQLMSNQCHPVYKFIIYHKITIDKEHFLLYYANKLYMVLVLDNIITIYIDEIETQC